MPEMNKRTDTFGRLSGYKVNYYKSEAIPLNHFQVFFTSPFYPSTVKYVEKAIRTLTVETFYLNSPYFLKLIRFWYQKMEDLSN